MLIFDHTGAEKFIRLVHRLKYSASLIPKCYILGGLALA